MASAARGPRTEEGKAKAAANSTKLGFYSQQAVLLSEEDHKEFEALSSAYMFELHPHSPTDRAIFAQVASVISRS